MQEENNEHRSTVCQFMHGTDVECVCDGEPVAAIPWCEELPNHALIITAVYVCIDHLEMIADTLADIAAL